MNTKKLLSVVFACAIMICALCATAFASDADVAEPVLVGTYEDLRAAFDAGYDVKLTEDITYSGVYNDGKTICVPSSRAASPVAVTLDLNGHTLKQTNTQSGGLSAAAIAIRPGSTLTVTDTSEEQTGKISACNCAFQNEGTLNLTAGSIVIGENPSGADTSSENGFAYGVWIYMASENAQVPSFNMTGGSISMVDNGYNDDYISAVSVNDGVDGIADCYKDAVINITNGTIEGNVVVHGNATNVTVPTGTDLVYLTKAAVVNGITYSSLQEAINAADIGDTVKLLANIETSEKIVVAADDDITLDLNGFTISGTFTEAKVSALIENKGTLVIDDTSAAKSGKITHFASQPSSSYSYANNTILNGGDLTIENGTIENTTSATGACYAIDTAWHSTVAPTLTINGGKVYNPYNFAVRMIGYSTTATNTMTVNGGIIEGTRAIWIQLPSSANAKKLIEVNIEGGTLKAIPTVSGGYEYVLAIYSYSYGDSYDGVSINISGGTIDGEVALGGGSSMGGSGAENVTITGGTIFDVYTYNDNAHNIEISGGTFKTDYFSEYLTDNYQAAQNADGTYGLEYIEAKDGVNWVSKSDSNGNAIRFLFDHNIDTSTIVKIGIKYVKGSEIGNIAESEVFAEDTAPKSAFYGDLVGIEEGSTEYYSAIAYVVTDNGTTYFSNVVTASAN